MIEAIAPAIQEGHCLLFVGSGLHAGPPEGSAYTYPEEIRPLSAPALSKRLAEKTAFLENEAFAEDDDANLLRTSLYFEMDTSRAQLIAEIKKAVQIGKEPSPLLKALASLDFGVIMTTNYDQLFEAALERFGKKPQVAIYNKERVATPEVGLPERMKPILIKLHGDIEKPESVVVTDEDYIDFVLRMNDPEEINPLPVDFKYFSKKFMTLFLGYSLLDYNLRVLFRAMRWTVDASKLQPTYALDLRPDPLIVNVWAEKRGYVQFIVQDAWEFVPALYQAITGEAMPR
jgi:hypothetical protein